MGSLAEKVKKQEENQEIKEKKISSVERPAPVTQISNNTIPKDKQISAKVNAATYRLFTQINQAQGLSNNSALNMIINKYVRENSGILDI